MKIYVQEDKNKLKENLSQRGYTLVNNESEPCDAIICDLKRKGLGHIVKNIPGSNTGTLIIDSGSKSVDDIENILNNKIYSDL